jgi:hypothetical protein
MKKFEDISICQKYANHEGLGLYFDLGIFYPQEFIERS